MSFYQWIKNWLAPNLQKPTPTILVVDDDPQMRNLIVHILKNDYLLCEAGNGLEAMNVMKKQQVHLLITDMVMPFHSGHRALIEAKEHYPQLKIIAMSGHPAALDKAQKVGVDMIMHKPLPLQELKKNVDRLLR